MCNSFRYKHEITLFSNNVYQQCSIKLSSLANRRLPLETCQLNFITFVFKTGLFQLYGLSPLHLKTLISCSIQKKKASYMFTVGEIVIFILIMTSDLLLAHRTSMDKYQIFSISLNLITSSYTYKNLVFIECPSYSTI